MSKLVTRSGRSARKDTTDNTVSWDFSLKKRPSPSSVHGRLKGSVFHAHEVCLRMLENPNEQDDPKLGRYLFIGDSISGHYDDALRTALKGKLNI